MRFKFHGMSAADFDALGRSRPRRAARQLSRDAYLQLERPSEREPVRRYATVAPGLFDAVVNRCVDAGQPVPCTTDDGATARAPGGGAALTPARRESADLQPQRMLT